jgi:hypothetical protein
VAAPLRLRVAWVPEVLRRTRNEYKLDNRRVAIQTFAETVLEAARQVLQVPHTASPCCPSPLCLLAPVVLYNLKKKKNLLVARGKKAKCNHIERTKERVHFLNLAEGYPQLAQRFF